MEFKKFSCGGIAYGKETPKKIDYPPGVTNVNFEDENVWDAIDKPEHPNHGPVTRFIECLGLCHTV